MSEPIALLLHSFGSSGRSWSHVRERLRCDSDAPDLPGFGDATPLGEPSVGGYADWVLDRMAATARPTVLVGASMGGKIAMAVASLRPQLLHALILCDPSPPTPEPIEAEERRRQLTSWGDPLNAERSVRGALAKNPPPDVFRALVTDWLATDRAAWGWWWESGSRESLSVERIATPTLILAGSADERLGADAQARLTVPLIAGARLQVVSGAGHLLAVDDPAAVATAIDAAVDAFRRPAPRA